MKTLKLKNILLELMAVLAIAAVMTSCEQEMSENTLENNQISSTSQPASDVNLNIAVTNGRLHFQDMDEFNAALDYLSDNPNRYFTDEALDAWEDELNFNSIRSSYEQANEEYAEIKDINEFRGFQEKYKDVIVFNENDNFEPIAFGIYSFIAENKYSSFQIGNNIHILKGNTQITFPKEMEHNIERIFEAPENYKDNGVYTHNLVAEEDNLRGACPANTSSLSCEEDNGTSNGDKKVEATYKLTIINNGDILLGNTVVREYTYRYVVTIESRVKKWWGWGKNKDDDIEFETGWGCTYRDLGFSSCFFWNIDFCHGTGWTQNSWRISYSKHIKNLLTTRSCVDLGYAPKIEYIYNNNYVQNNDASGVSCENDCWTRGCN